MLVAMLQDVMASALAVCTSSPSCPCFSLLISFIVNVLCEGDPTSCRETHDSPDVSDKCSPFTNPSHKTSFRFQQLCQS
uniref:Secreted protein n=1 Tax=Pyxicephalus adspersus TaxID=30357 RepID=A0AAV3A7Y7_PYXAD|nr:TPA: hypothetical protein GDO54_011461 [Pyxicephalus adspersus]